MENKKTYLITTPIEEEYISSKYKKLYLSDWFPKNLKKKYNYDILNNRWDSIKCKNNDFKLIKKTFYIHLNFLSAYLAKYHNLDYSKSLYKHIIFVWLLHYISFQYFRWSSINEVLKKKKLFCFLDMNFKEASFDIKDTLDFVDLAFESDLFNYINFKRIIYNFKNCKNLKIVNYKNSTQLPKKKISNFQLFRSSLYKKKILITLLNFYEKIMFILTKNNKVFFVDVVSSKFFLKLNLYLNQFPNIFYNKFAWNIIKKRLYDNIRINSYDERQSFLKKKEPYKTNSKNKFDFFISKHIVSDIPYCFLGGFKTLDNETKKINLNPKIIFTSISHFYNELFKIWSFKRKLNKESLLVVLRHGGIHHKYQDLFSFYERFISSKYIGFVKKYFSKSTISLPSIKYFYLNKNCRSSKNLKELCYVSYEFRTYPVRLGVGPSSFKSHLAIEDFKSIHSNLNLDIRNNFSFLPNNTFHDIYKKQLLDFLPKKKILENSSLKKNIKRFKLIICSYPLTAFIDSMLTGPTILVYNPKWWTPMNEFKKVYYLMKKNQIIFEDPKEAAKHINLNWENLDAWWSNKETKKARENFLNKFNIGGKKSYFEYKNFFDNLLSKKV
jgi:putative transferase (TIGR04331 family)